MQRTNSRCGNSSVGRARPCQGRGREFEPRFPLQARVVESVDTRDLKSLAFRGVPVQVWPRAPFYGRENNSKKQSRERLFLCLKFVTVLIVVKKFLKKKPHFKFLLILKSAVCFSTVFIQIMPYVANKQCHQLYRCLPTSKCC